MSDSKDLSFFDDDDDWTRQVIPSNPIPLPAYRTRAINCEFYRLELGETNPETYSGMLRAICRYRPTPESLNLSDGEDIFRLHDVRYQSNGTYCVLLRIRPTSNHQVIHVCSDVIEDIPLAPGTHLVDFTTFAYFKEMSVLVAARHKDTVNALKFGSYIRKISEPHTADFRAVFPQLIMIDKDLDQLYRSGKLAGVAVSIDIAESNNLYSDDDGDLNETIRLGQRYNASALTMTMTWGHSREPLADGIKNFMVRALNNVGIKTTSLRYKPAEDTSDADKEFYIDLVKGKYRKPQTVKYQGEKPCFTDYFEALARGYEQALPDLRKKLKAPK